MALINHGFLSKETNQLHNYLVSLLSRFARIESYSKEMGQTLHIIVLVILTRKEITDCEKVFAFILQIVKSAPF